MTTYDERFKKANGKGDTLLKLFMGNEHREKIKQIYAQTDKILEDTLYNGECYLSNPKDLKRSTFADRSDMKIVDD